VVPFDGGWAGLAEVMDDESAEVEEVVEVVENFEVLPVAEEK
jgi:hypothetical protein